MINSFRTPPGTIVVEDINKVFFLTKPGKKDCEFHALKDISLRIGSGECVGIIGRNGSGKSTLLKIIAGILKPTNGNIIVKGKIMPFIELGVGFDEELTGRGNVYLYGSLLGIRREKLDREFNNIVELSQLEDFIDTPLKKYSSGMRVRLAFSTAVVNDFDIILIDEILAVGDELFQKKSRDKIREMKLKGKTIVVVSHSMEDIRDICDRAVLLDHGKIICWGDAEDVVNYYRDITTKVDLHRLRIAVRNKLKRLKELEGLYKVRSQKQEGKLDRFLSIVGKREGRSDTKQLIESARMELLSLIEERETVINVRENILGKRIHLNLAESSGMRERLRLIKNHDKNYLQLRKKQESISAKLDADETELKLLHKEHSKILLIKLRYSGGLKENISSHGHLIQTLKSQIGCSMDDARKREYISILINFMVAELNYNTDLNLVTELLRDQYTSCMVPFVRIIGREDRRRYVQKYIKICTQTILRFADNKVTETVITSIFTLLNEGLMPVSDTTLIIWTIQETKGKYASIVGRQLSQKQIDAFGDILRRLLFQKEKELLAVKMEIRNNPSDRAQMLERKEKLESEIALVTQALVDLYTGGYVADEQHDQKKGWGFGDVVIEDVKFQDADGNVTDTFVTDSYFRATISFNARKRIIAPVFGIAVYTEDGVHVTGPNTTTSDLQIGEIEGKGCLSFVIENLPLMDGRYSLSAAVYDSKNYLPFDHHHRLYNFTVICNSRMKGDGLVKIPHKWEFSVIEKKVRNKE